MSDVVRLDPSDNVVTATRPIEIGALVEGAETQSLIPRGHKVATERLQVGDPVRKYAQVIG